MGIFDCFLPVEGGGGCWFGFLESDLRSFVSAKDAWDDDVTREPPSPKIAFSLVEPKNLTSLHDKRGKIDDSSLVYLRSRSSHHLVFWKKHDEDITRGLCLSFSLEGSIAGKISQWHDPFFLGHGNNKTRLDYQERQQESQGCLDWHWTHGSGKSRHALEQVHCSTS